MAKGFVRKDGKERMISANAEETLLSALRKAGYAIHSPCGGNGTCGKCKVYAKGMLSALTEEEKRFLRPDEIDRGMRLACKTRIHGDFEVELPAGTTDIKVETLDPNNGRVLFVGLQVK